MTLPSLPFVFGLTCALRSVAEAPAQQTVQPAPPDHDTATSHEESLAHAREIDRSFYLHASVGPGLLFAATDAPSDTRRFFGTSVAFQIAVAGEVGTGVLFGGAYFRDQVLTMSTHDVVLDGDEPTLDDISFSFDRAGLLLAVIPNPDGGAHIQAFLGWGDLNTHRPGTQDFDDPSGPVFSLAAGYEWFLSAHWRLGGLFRFTYAPLVVDETQQAGSDTQVTTWLPTLLVSATYY